MYNVSLTQVSTLTEKQDSFFYARLGTSDLTGLFYDYVDDSLTVRLLDRAERKPTFASVLIAMRGSIAAKKAAVAIRHYLRAFYYYLDLTKDVMLAVG